jgi:hypothetical protein
MLSWLPNLTVYPHVTVLHKVGYESNCDGKISEMDFTFGKMSLLIFGLGKCWMLGDC